MSINSKILDEILGITEKYFVCLRCGECCFRWAVTLPDGTVKPENSKCSYLEDISVNENKWNEATCKIYDIRPDVCKNFKISFATVCPLGLWKWLKLKESEPTINLPDKVQKILKILKD